MNYNHKISILPLIPLLATGLNACSVEEHPAEQKLPIILFIPVDDLRPDLSCYGNKYIKHLTLID